MMKYRKPVQSSTTIRYETPSGKEGIFELDFDNPSTLFRTLEDIAGYDFALQFQDEYEAWYNENVATLRDVVDDFTKEAFNDADNCSSNISAIRDSVNELNEIAREVQDNEMQDKLNGILSLLDDAEGDISATLGGINDLRENLGQEAIY